MSGYAADLLSDTLTRPTPAMREAMAWADVGDDVFGEDPTVRLLEQRVAELLGHEAGLFSPTGSLANQLGVRLHVSPGQELVADSLAHVLRAELGAAAAFSGITSRSWPAERGLLDPAGPMSLVTTGVGPYQVETALVVVENTHNFGGGTVQPLEAIRAVREATQPLGVAMHLDGARLWNAHVASGVPLSAYGGQFDTVSVCLSKGLGAPIGSLLVGSTDRMAEARVWRKRYGAGMRQVGILAAAGLYALDHHVGRLADDHARARRFA
ncbi:MAG: threonine aldolase family protein, partial [Ornithinibacter sp.]